jgi:transposase-like protein
MKKSRRNFSAGFKAKIAMETIKGIKTIAEIPQEYEIHPVQVSSWEKALMEKAADVFE